MLRAASALMTLVAVALPVLADTVPRASKIDTAALCGSAKNRNGPRASSITVAPVSAKARVAKAPAALACTMSRAICHGTRLHGVAMLSHKARVAEARAVLAHAVATAVVVLAARRGDIFAVLPMEAGLAVT